MIVYRLCRTKWAEDINGEGARLNGGRWNHNGIPCIYTSESRALAVLEYTVNINIHDIPRALSILSIKIPDEFLDCPVSKLPGNWRDSPAPASTRDFGTDKLEMVAGDNTSNGKNVPFAVLRFPSAVIPEEFNYVLNPLHPDASFKVIEIKDFVYDTRIKLV